MEVTIIPNAFLDRLSGDAGRRHHINVALSALLLSLVAVLLAGHQETLGFLPHACLAEMLFGIVCPGCGVTRSAFAVLAGDFTRAWTFNPAGPFLCATVAFQVPLRSLVLMGGCESWVVVRISRAMNVLVASVLSVNWLVQVLKERVS